MNSIIVAAVEGSNSRVVVDRVVERAVIDG